MASRWMAPKLLKMKQARKFTPHDTKHRAGHTIETSNVASAALAKIVAGYTGVVTICETGKPLVAQGKGKRQFDAPAKLDQYHGGGARLAPVRKLAAGMIGGWRDRDLAAVRWDEGSRFTLIKNGR